MYNFFLSGLSCLFLFLSIQAHPLRADPYQWLEQMDSPATEAWVKKQNQITDEYFLSLSERDHAWQEMIRFSSYDSMGIPVEKGTRQFFLYHPKEDDLAGLWMQEAGEDPIRLFAPPFNEKGHQQAIEDFVVAPDGSKVAVALSHAGSDELVWQFVPVDPAVCLYDLLAPAKFSSIVWDDAGGGVFYIDSHQSLCYHRVWSGQGDKIIKSGSNFFSLSYHPVAIVAEGRYLLVSFYDQEGNNGMALLDKRTHQVSPLFPTGKGTYTFSGESEGELFFVTNVNAPMQRLVSVSLKTPYPFRSRVVIPETESLLVEALPLSEGIACCYLEDCASSLYFFTKMGEKIQEIQIPGKGSVVFAPRKLHLQPRQDGSGFFYGYMDSATPLQIFAFDVPSRTSTLLFAPSFPSSAASFKTEQHFVISHDGTKTPLFLVYRKDLDLEIPHPTLMYGYGGFGVSMSLFYTPLIRAWLEAGGIYVSVNLRGGGEYGEAWHEMGRREKKQAVFSDFADAALYLIDNGYTLPSNLAITGRSNGGLLVAATLLQHPELFAAAIPQVGVYDMLRFPLFTVGARWKQEFGDPGSRVDRSFLLAYSPYHSIVHGAHYPAIFITTGDSDDRVVPLHSYKFFAALKEAQASDSPILLRVYSQTGHGVHASRKKSIQEYAEMFQFLLETTQEKSN